VKLFIDESGHTGKHLFDGAQPLFVYAGVWLDEPAQVALDGALPELRARHGMPSTELKGTRLVASARGRRFLAECLRACSSRGAHVSVVVLNKPFQAAAVVVEDCTDHVYNPAFDARWTWDTRLKEPLAKKIYELSDPKDLMEVWRNRTGPRELFEQSYRRLLFALQLSVDDAVSDAARRMSQANFGEIWESAQFVNRVGWSYSPNFNAFVSVAQGANEQATIRGIESVELVHDEQVQYQAALADVFRVLTKAAQGELPLPNGNTFKLPLDRLTSLSFVRSESEIGLQLADFAASLARTIASEGAVDRELLGPAARWLMEGGDGVFPYFIGPTDWQKDIFMRFAKAAGVVPAFSYKHFPVRPMNDA